MTHIDRCVIKAKMLTGEDSTPVGTAFPVVGDELPAGYVWGEGQVLSKYDYPELHAVLKRPLPPWRYPVKRVREMVLRAQHKFRVPDFRASATTFTYRKP